MKLFKTKDFSRCALSFIRFGLIAKTFFSSLFSSYQNFKRSKNEIQNTSPGPNLNSCRSFSIFHWFLNSLLAHSLLNCLLSAYYLCDLIRSRYIKIPSISQDLILRQDLLFFRSVSATHATVKRFNEF